MFNTKIKLDKPQNWWKVFLPLFQEQPMCVNKEWAMRCDTQQKGKIFETRWTKWLTARNRNSSSLRIKAEICIFRCIKTISLYIHDRSRFSSLSFVTSVLLISKTVTTRLSPSHGSTLKLEISCYNTVFSYSENSLHKKKKKNLIPTSNPIQSNGCLKKPIFRRSKKLDLSYRISDSTFEEDRSGVSENSPESIQFRDSEILQIGESTPRASLC